jgi:Fe-S-cluster containining protein
MTNRRNTPADPAARAWLAAIARGEVRSALEGLYTECTRAIETRGPACWASGRCCNFKATGHLLYVTGLEAAYTVANLPPQPDARHATTLDPPPAAAGIRSLPVLSIHSLTRAVEDGGCPFQEANLCGVHSIRPMGCRVYFCDRTAQAWQHELSEDLHRRVRALHAEMGIEYRYAEWRAMLALFA